MIQQSPGSQGEGETNEEETVLLSALLFYIYYTYVVVDTGNRRNNERERERERAIQVESGHQALSHVRTAGELQSSFPPCLVCVLFCRFCLSFSMSVRVSVQVECVCIYSSVQTLNRPPLWFWYHWSQMMLMIIQINERDHSSSCWSGLFAGTAFSHCIWSRPHLSRGSRCSCFWALFFSAVFLSHSHSRYHNALMFIFSVSTALSRLRRFFCLKSRRNLGSEPSSAVRRRAAWMDCCLALTRRVSGYFLFCFHSFVVGYDTSRTANTIWHRLLSYGRSKVKTREETLVYKDRQTVRNCCYHLLRIALVGTCKWINKTKENKGTLGDLWLGSAALFWNSRFQLLLSLALPITRFLSLPHYFHCASFSPSAKRTPFFSRIPFLFISFRCSAEKAWQVVTSLGWCCLSDSSNLKIHINFLSKLKSPPHDRCFTCLPCDVK